MTQEHFPEFFEQAPTLTVQDALAEFLGAAEEGIMQYRYADAVLPHCRRRVSHDA